MQDSNRRLTWNEFQKQFKGRWSRKELASKYADHKASGLINFDNPDIPSLLQPTPQGSLEYQQQPRSDFVETTACTAHIGAEPKFNQVGHQLTWNQFQDGKPSFISKTFHGGRYCSNGDGRQAKHKGMWPRDALSAAYAHYKLTGNLPALPPPPVAPALPERAAPALQTPAAPSPPPPIAPALPQTAASALQMPAKLPPTTGPALPSTAALPPPAVPALPSTADPAQLPALLAAFEQYKLTRDLPTLLPPAATAAGLATPTGLAASARLAASAWLPTPPRPPTQGGGLPAQRPEPSAGPIPTPFASDSLTEPEAKAIGPAAAPIPAARSGSAGSGSAGHADTFCYTMGWNAFQYAATPAGLSMEELSAAWVQYKVTGRIPSSRTPRSPSRSPQRQQQQASGHIPDSPSRSPQHQQRASGRIAHSPPRSPSQVQNQQVTGCILDSPSRSPHHHQQQQATGCGLDPTSPTPQEQQKVTGHITHPLSRSPQQQEPPRSSGAGRKASTADGGRGEPRPGISGAGKVRRWLGDLGEKLTGKPVLEGGTAAAAGGGRVLYEPSRCTTPGSSSHVTSVYLHSSSAAAATAVADPAVSSTICQVPAARRSPATTGGAGCNRSGLGVEACGAHDVANGVPYRGTGGSQVTKNHGAFGGLFRRLRKVFASGGAKTAAASPDRASQIGDGTVSTAIYLQHSASLGNRTVIPQSADGMPAPAAPSRWEDDPSLACRTPAARLPTSRCAAEEASFVTWGPAGAAAMTEQEAGAAAWAAAAAASAWAAHAMDAAYAAAQLASSPLSGSSIVGYSPNPWQSAGPHASSPSEMFFTPTDPATDSSQAAGNAAVTFPSLSVPKTRARTAAEGGKVPGWPWRLKLDDDDGCSDAASAEDCLIVSPPAQQTVRQQQQHQAACSDSSLSSDVCLVISPPRQHTRAQGRARRVAEDGSTSDPWACPADRDDTCAAVAPSATPGSQQELQQQQLQQQQQKAQGQLRQQQKVHKRQERCDDDDDGDVTVVAYRPADLAAAAAAAARSGCKAPGKVIPIGPFTPGVPQQRPQEIGAAPSSEGSCTSFEVLEFEGNRRAPPLPPPPPPPVQPSRRGNLGRTLHTLLFGGATHHGGDSSGSGGGGGGGDGFDPEQQGAERQQGLDVNADQVRWPGGGGGRVRKGKAGGGGGEQFPGMMDPRVAQLRLFDQVVRPPAPGCLRVQARERMPHSHDRLFSGFGAWLPVVPSDLRDARMAIPYKPGLYEWGAKAPGGRNIVAFYLGKAGTLKVTTGGILSGRKRVGKETLRTRFNKYATAGRLLGPSQEEGVKVAVFSELQKRGFSMWYRFWICEEMEPLDLETCILTQVDYALNFQNNGCRRALLLEGGRSLEQYPLVKLPAGMKL